MHLWQLSPGQLWLSCPESHTKRQLEQAELRHAVASGTPLRTLHHHPAWQAIGDGEGQGIPRDCPPGSQCSAHTGFIAPCISAHSLYPLSHCALPAEPPGCLGHRIWVKEGSPSPSLLWKGSEPTERFGGTHAMRGRPVVVCRVS